jgi:hypothetical protein
MFFTILTSSGALAVLAGFLIAPRGHGWFALALICWIAGGVYTLAFGGFLIGAMLDAARFVREGRQP